MTYVGALRALLSGALVLIVFGFVAVARRGRHRWGAVTTGTLEANASAYRGGEVQLVRPRRTPAIVLVAAACGFTVTLAAAPWLALINLVPWSDPVLVLAFLGAMAVPVFGAFITIRASADLLLARKSAHARCAFAARALDRYLALPASAFGVLGIVFTVLALFTEGPFAAATAALLAAIPLAYAGAWYGTGQLLLQGSASLRCLEEGKTLHSIVSLRQHRGDS